MAAYHEAFWLVTGTAAPVIALAVVVAAPDLAPAASSVAAQADADGGHVWSWRDPTIRYIEGLQFLNFVALISLLSQIMLLLMSLLSIMHGRNAVSPVLGVWLAMGGLVLLCVIALVAPLWRVSWKVAAGRPGEESGPSAAADSSTGSGP